MVELQDAIGQRLDYFQELEHATRMLNHPGDSLVLQTDFLYMVERVDVCIDFLKAHVRLSPAPTLTSRFTCVIRVQRHFREAELYLLRFQQCMTRAMTLIKMFFVGSLRALTQDITRRLSEKVRPSPWASQYAVMHATLCPYLLCPLPTPHVPPPIHVGTIYV